MSVPNLKNILPRDAKNIFGKISQTNYYQVSFGLPEEVRKNAKNKFGISDPNRFISEKGGLLCSDASLPGSNLATTEVKDNFMGIPQEFAHTRLYADIDFTFYVDHDYTNLTIFESWIDYIASGSEVLGPIGDGMNEFSSNYYRRMRYPDTYKCDTMYITKFERDVNVNRARRIDYLFINAFPKLVNAIPVSYGGADVLKVGVSFNYDRYILNPNGKLRGKVNPNEPSNQQFNSLFENTRTQSSVELGQYNQNVLGSLQGTSPAATGAPEEPLTAGQQAALTESTRTGYVSPYAPPVAPSTTNLKDVKFSEGGF